MALNLIIKHKITSTTIIKILASLVIISTIALMMVLLFQDKSDQAQNQTTEYKQIFSDYHSSIDLQKRKDAAKDLENFLQHAKFKDQNLAVLNRKLIPIGIEVQKDGSVTILSDKRWKELFNSLKPDEIIKPRSNRIHLPKVEQEELIVRISPRKAPVISEIQIEEEEEESSYYNEDLDNPRNIYEEKVNRRAKAVKNYLYSTFSSAINHRRHGLRKTVINGYIDDTFKHYKKKAEEK
ncbi:MAG: hypothetical protein ACI4M9_08615 [Succinivibrio sp.]